MKMNTEKYIPKISDEKLNELYKRIKPVIYFEKKEKCKHCGSVINEYFHSEDEKGELFYIEDCNPRNAAFSWDPEKTKKAENIEPFKEITTYHTWAYYGFFKPFIAEVLSQIPNDVLEETVAFLTIGPKTVAI